MEEKITFSTFVNIKKNFQAIKMNDLLFPFLSLFLYLSISVRFTGNLRRRNIYYHPLESGTMRDIFLQPFNNQLFGCVAATYLVLLIAMATVVYAAKTVLHNEDEKHVGIGEAALWCISIMCMQGSALDSSSSSLRRRKNVRRVRCLVCRRIYASHILKFLARTRRR